MGWTSILYTATLAEVGTNQLVVDQQAGKIAYYNTA